MNPANLKLNLFFFAVFAVSVTGHAQERWCSIQGGFKDYQLAYPPIARAARVQGQVIERITYTPSGEITNLEAIHGARLLTDYVEKQMKNWRVKTKAQGEAPCVSLAVFDFTIGETQPLSPQPTSPVILRRSIHGEILALNTLYAEAGKLQ